jgi:hypothetical protein
MFLEEVDVKERAFEVCIGLHTGVDRYVFCTMLYTQTLQIALLDRDFRFQLSIEGLWGSCDITGKGRVWFVSGVQKLVGCLLA